MVTLFRTEVSHVMTRKVQRTFCWQTVFILSYQTVPLLFKTKDAVSVVPVNSFNISPFREERKPDLRINFELLFCILLMLM